MPLVRVTGLFAYRILTVPFVHILTNIAHSFTSNLFLGIKSRTTNTKKHKLFKKENYPKVSVIVPTYNAEKTILTSINSLLNQTYSNIEILIINDASTDGTLDILKQYQYHPKITIINNLRNHGAAYSKNIGLKKSKGDYITFQDSDDISSKFRIELQLYSLLMNPKKVISIAQYKRINSSRIAIRLNGRIKAKALVTLFFNKTKVMNTLGYFRTNRIGEDSEFYQRAIAYYGDEKMCYLNKILYFALLREDSLTFSDGNLEKINDYVFHHRSSLETKKNLTTNNFFHDQIKNRLLSPYVKFPEQNKK